MKRKENDIDYNFQMKLVKKIELFHKSLFGFNLRASFSFRLWRRKYPKTMFYQYLLTGDIQAESFGIWNFSCHDEIDLKSLFTQDRLVGKRLTEKKYSFMFSVLDFPQIFF